MTPSHRHLFATGAVSGSAARRGGGRDIPPAVAPNPTTPVAPFVDTGDPAAWETALKAMTPERAKRLEVLADMVWALNRQIRRLRAGARPAKMVQTLEEAKALLAYLQMHETPHELDFPNLSTFRGRLRALEQTFRAFGYYRMAGVK